MYDNLTVFELKKKEKSKGKGIEGIFKIKTRTTAHIASQTWLQEIIHQERDKEIIL